jgi:hypothetical protein
MMTRQHNCGSKSAQNASGWRASLATVLKERNGTRHDGAVASYATRAKRADVLYAGFSRLRELSFKLDTVTSLRGKHVAKLMQDGQHEDCPHPHCRILCRSSEPSPSGSARPALLGLSMEAIGRSPRYGTTHLWIWSWSRCHVAGVSALFFVNSHSSATATNVLWISADVGSRLQNTELWAR